MWIAMAKNAVHRRQVRIIGFDFCVVIRSRERSKVVNVKHIYLDVISTALVATALVAIAFVATSKILNMLVCKNIVSQLLWGYVAIET